MPQTVNLSPKMHHSLPGQQPSHQIGFEKPTDAQGEPLFTHVQSNSVGALPWWCLAQVHGDEKALHRGGSVSHRRAQSDCLQNRLPITQHFGKVRTNLSFVFLLFSFLHLSSRCCACQSRPRRPGYKHRAAGDEQDATDAGDPWDRWAKTAWTCWNLSESNLSCVLMSPQTCN